MSDARTGADEVYRRAEGRFLAGDFEAAEQECDAVLRLDPDHGAAHALRYEVLYILGRARWPAEWRLPHAPMRTDQLVVELEETYQRAVRAFNLGDRTKAGRELHYMLALIRWLHTSPEVEDLRVNAESLLRKSIDPCGRPRPPEE